eukprot:scaffold1749_cov181-Amphora_coffeaeformis.AAC.3
MFEVSKSLVLIALVGLLIPTTTVASSNNNKLLSAPPVSLQHGLGKVWQNRWDRASTVALLEQQVEDYNAAWIAQSTSTAQACRHRRCLVLPLDEGFDPVVGTFSHGHVQSGDKMSLPRNFWQAIELNKAEVPWLFKVSRIDGVTAARVNMTSTVTAPGNNIVVDEHVPFQALDAVVGGPLDFRAPANYVFLPWWMMRSLGLRPRDVVQVELITTVPPGSLARLRPHSSQFAKNIANPQAVLETELRHYSSLTRGSTIAFDYNQQRYWLDVVECRSAPKGEKQPLIKVQDCDIATEFLPAKDIKRKKPNRKEEDE